MAKEQSTIGKLRSLSKISVNFGGEVEASLVRDFLAMIDTAELQQAKVACLFQDPSEGNSPSFSGLGHVLKWLPRGLTRLSLCQLRFTDLGNWQLGAYQDLTHLELKDCRHSGSVLKDAALPRLRRLIVRFTGFSLQDDLDHCIAFIERGHYLKVLMIDNELSPGDLTNPSTALERHQHCLQALLVQCSPVYCAVIPQWLSASAFKELRQLGTISSDHDQTGTLWQIICVSTFLTPSGSVP